MALIRCPKGHLFSEKKHGVICPFCSRSVSDTYALSEDPQGMYADRTLMDLDPLKRIVGWLVCVNGPSIGKDYRIVPEKNFIGRSSEMDIRILNDNSVSQTNHATIVYDPEKNSTTLLPGDSHGLVYIYDDEDRWEAIHEYKEIEAGERIKLGKSEFIFVPFCSGGNGGFAFNWRDNDGKCDDME